MLKALHAENGDSISIRYFGQDNKYHNLLIDGGLKKTYQKVLKNEISSIKENDEKIDLIVVTHIDQDHIGGILGLVSDVKADHDIIGKFWFNSGQIISNYFDTPLIPLRNIGLFNKSKEVSIKQGISFEDFLLRSKKWHALPIISLQTFNLYGINLTVLSPSINGLKKLNQKWVTELDKKDSNKISSKDNDYGVKIEKLIKNKYERDSSIPNLSSIALLIEKENKKILLAGDAHSEEIYSSLESLKLISKTKRLKIDYWKLSHHGSKKSTNCKLISAIDCQNFIISTSGRRFNLPNKELLSKILCNPCRNTSEKIFFYFNYSNKKLQSIFSSSEKCQYNFECIFLNKNETINV